MPPLVRSRPPNLAVRAARRAGSWAAREEDGLFRKIVVADDGSDEARAAAALAFRLAAAAGAEVTLVRVLDPPGTFVVHPEIMEGLQRMQRAAEEDAAAALERLAAQAPDGVTVAREVLHGRPAAKIAEQLRRGGADLAVAGTRGVGGARQALVGSVSQQVAEHAPCPVLLVRGEAPLDPIATVVAAVDGSEPALAGLEQAQSLAVALSAPLRLVHVVDPRIPFVGPVPPDARGEIREHGERILREARDRVVAPIDNVVVDLREGPPNEELLAACEESLPAIAVVGSRGMHGFGGLLMGSTTRALVNRAPCPVLVTRRRDAAEAG